MPRARNRLTAGPVTVAGVAWAQHRGSAASRYASTTGPGGRRNWPRGVGGHLGAVVVALGGHAGEHRLQVRATDATGDTQTEWRQDVVPDGATGWHEVRVKVR